MTQGRIHRYLPPITGHALDSVQKTHMYPPPHMTHMYPPPHMTHMYPPTHAHDSVQKAPEFSVL